MRAYEKVCFPGPEPKGLNLSTLAAALIVMYLVSRSRRLHKVPELEGLREPWKGTVVRLLNPLAVCPTSQTVLQQAQSYGTQTQTT